MSLIVLPNDCLLKHFYEFTLLFFLALVNTFWVIFAVCSDIVAPQNTVYSCGRNLDLVGYLSDRYFFFQIEINDLLFFRL